MKTVVYRNLLVLAGVLVLLIGTPLLGQAAPPAQGPLGPSNETLVDQLNKAAGGDVRISYHSETGKVRFIGTSPDGAVAQPSILGVNPSAEDAARGFLIAYGKLFGLDNPNEELIVMKERTLDDGRAFVRFQQTYQGIPIIGGELIIQSGGNSSIISANGEILPDLDLDTTPTITTEEARQTALAKVAKDYDLNVSDLTASKPELWIYNPALLGGPGPRFNALVWRIEVTPLELAPLNEFVLIDARLGAVALHFNQVDMALNRETYDANNGTSLPGTLRCNESNPTCSGGDSHEVAAHTYAGDTYNFYLNRHGRDSIDNGGVTIKSTVHYGSNYSNAFWNGSQMVYGDAYGYPLADDVVAHELTHGVTNYESNLFYFYQSGAINESLSDVWGEFVDLYGATGNDSGDTRWDMGEDVSGYTPLRNMQYPTTKGDPDRMTSSYYYCQQSELSDGSGDNGGVHSNSGVNNKAAYLMTDGDSFNGYAVTGLGYAKVAALYYEVQTGLLTSASDYADLYDALIQACSNLGYSPGDCQEVKDAVDATEMNQQPTSCAATHAPICDSGSPTYHFFDDIESGSGNWTAGSNSGTPYWFVPQTSSTIGFADPYATSGVGNIWSPNWESTSDTYLAMNSDVTLPANAYMHFNHSFGFESSTPTGSTKYDGGILEYSANGGSSWINAGSLFTHNPYNGTLESSNPLGAISAFSADSRGYISSRLNLSSLVGQNVRFRFRIGADSSVYDYGWYIDDVGIYTCGAGNTSPRFLSSGLPTQAVSIGGSKDNAINLWQYVDDYEDSDEDLSFTFCNSPDVNAGVTIDSDRFIDITTTLSWTGGPTEVCVRATDTGSQWAESTFTIGTGNLVYLPVIIKSPPPPPLPDTLTATEDTMIAQGYPTSNYCNLTNMLAGYDEVNFGYVVRSLIKFDVSSIPSGTSISQVTLNLRHATSYDFPNRSRTMTIYRASSSWSSCTTTWNSQPGIAEAYGSQSIPFYTGSWYAFDVTNLVRGWVDGSISNQGLWLRGPEWSGSDSSYRSFSTVNSSSDPYLSITYSGATGTKWSESVNIPASHEEDETQMSYSFVNKLGISPPPNLCQNDTSNVQKCLKTRP